MLPLDEYQAQVASWLLAPHDQSTEHLHPSIARSRPALCAHQRTIFKALVKALQRAFPTVARLLARDLFWQVASQYARQYPPQSAVLQGYGERFPEHLTRALSGSGCPIDSSCLFDLARCDLLVDQAAHESLALFERPIRIAPATRVRVARSLRCGRFDHAVDLIRAAVLAGHTDPALLRSERALRMLAIWRTSSGVSVKSLSEPAAAFLDELIRGRAVERACERAAEGCGSDRALEAVRREVLTSSFCQIITPSTPDLR